MAAAVRHLPGRVGAATRSQQAPKRRDGTKTRELLLEAARRRFAADGYAATTVRDIADEADVNVALISRYYKSKEGLFEACIAATVDELEGAGAVSRISEIPEALARQLIGSDADDRRQQILPLLLRSSGDKKTDELRISMLRTFSERMAALAGWRPGVPDDEDVLLRSQFVLSAVIGLALLRSMPELTPLACASDRALTSMLTDLVGSLFPDR